MYLQWLHVDYSESKLSTNEVEENLYWLLLAFYENGQCEVYFDCLKPSKNKFSFQVKTPEKNSIAKQYCNSRVKKRLTWLKEKKVTLTRALIGKEHNSESICQCSDSKGYIMNGGYCTTEAIYCIDCDGYVPLYRFPATFEDNHLDIVNWCRNYRACIESQFQSTMLWQMYNFNSELTKEGLGCRDVLSKSINKPVYYPLYRYYSSCYEQDIARKCPSCGGEWLLEEKWQRFYDFRCDHCHLVSNLANMYSF